MLQSAGFARNQRMCRFLQFVVERAVDGRSAELKETVIATEVFGRPTDYNPKQDAIVRTEAGRLRSRLGEYYSSEGAADPVVIELPRGGYVPAFHINSTSPAAVATQAGPEAAHKSPFRLNLIGTVASVVLLLSSLGLWIARPHTPISIAVLPFDNLNHDPADDYLADGMTDELIRTLATFEGVAVRSRTSSFALKGRPRNVRVAAGELGVEYVVEGAVLREGDTLRINAQLIRAKDDFSVWSGRFERNRGSILTVQDGISRAIASNLPIKLGRARKRADVNPEAYDLYLRGLAAGLMSGRDFFEQSIEKDPSFAPAQAAAAAAFAFMSNSPTAPGENARYMDKMLASARKSIELDPLLPEAHCSMGIALARGGKWAEAEHSFRRAIELNPNRSATYGEFAVSTLMSEGRIPEALREMRIAEKADPLSPEVRSQLAYVLLSSHLYDEAAAECERLPDDCRCWPAPNEPVRNECLGRARIGQGRVKEGMEILAAGVAKGVSRGAPIRGYLGYAYGLLGRRAEAQRVADDDWRNPYHQALAYLGMGEKDKAIEAAMRMNVSGPMRIGLALAVPEFDSIRDDPRIKALRKTVGLSP